MYTVTVYTVCLYLDTIQDIKQITQVIHIIQTVYRICYLLLSFSDVINKQPTIVMRFRIHENTSQVIHLQATAPSVSLDFIYSGPQLTKIIQVPFDPCTCKEVTRTTMIHIKVHIHTDMW